MGRILLVDDEEQVRMIAQIFLTRAGHDVCCAGDGLEALEITRAPDEGKKFDLLITDVCMPNLNGLLLIEQLKQNGFTAPVLIMTGADDVEGLRGQLPAGDYHFLDKMYISTKLTALAQKLLAG